MDSIRNGLETVGTAIATAARTTGSSIYRAAVWCTNSRAKRVLLGTVGLTAVAVGAYAHNPQRAKALAASIENWAKNTAFPRLATMYYETIVPTAHIVRSALYKHGKVTPLGAGLIGATVALVALSVGHAFYRFVRPNATLAQRDAAIVARDEAIAERDVAIQARNGMEAQYNAAILARDGAVLAQGRAVAAHAAAVAAQTPVLAERDAAFAERNAALAERNAALTERNGALTERDAALTERDAALTERDAALAERNAALTQRDEALTQRDEATEAAVEIAAEADEVNEGLGAELAKANADYQNLLDGYTRAIEERRQLRQELAQLREKN